MRFQDICRVCLKEGSMTSIYTTQKMIGERKVSCTDMLLACGGVPIDSEDGFPSHICGQCYRKLCSAFKFRQLCETSFNYLLDYTTNRLKDDAIKKEILDEVTSDGTNKIEVNCKTSKLKFEDCELQEMPIQYLKEETLEIEKDFDNDNGINDDRFDSADEDYEMSLTSIAAAHKEAKLKKKTKKMERKMLKKKLKHIKCFDDKEETSPDTLPCSLCPKVFKWKYLLVAHQDSHLGIKRYFCDLCQKSYRNEKDHKNMHRRGFNFKCEICSKGFNTKAKLAIHIDTHSTVREKVICDVEGCKKTFISVNGLDRHRISHSGQKDFICHLCSKSFIDKYQLEVHIRTHTNERPHPCGFCDKMFITTSARNSHERWHTNTKNHHCKFCEKSFVSSSGLKRHIYCHTKEQLQSCRFCGKKFARIDNKKRHETAMHGVTEEPTLS